MKQLILDIENKSPLALSRVGSGNPNWGGGKVDKECIICGKVFKVSKGLAETRLCCSRKCSGLTRRHPRTSILKVCEICGKHFYVYKSILNRGGNSGKFCSRKCYYVNVGRRQLGKNNPMWCGGKSFEIYPQEFNNTLKEEIRSRDGHKCQKCSTPQIKLAKNLIVHHIDYNKKNCNKNNLISLCQKCHNKTNKNREHWKEYFTNFMNKTMEILCLKTLS